MLGDKLGLILIYSGEFLWLMQSVTLHPDVTILYFTFPEFRKSPRLTGGVAVAAALTWTCKVSRGKNFFVTW